ncbi:MAG: signal recognition particle subunit SRP19/SEC65 family protein [Ferroplasma sp.]|uniref:signal recognition particle subunit SRP19/SEC65 family protein n=1 Tax=Ferroplasma sp. TaxID=2591003 RepID=UPI00281543F7|nr:signal recognition particle subunit SRP19/SEC65 family protein [Ferroplasma sp.]WMT51956.1 MAG: signal recognition particle subunit SRP19/SEC65 family protein [Ferroplasma sp.]
MIVLYSQYFNSGISRRLGRKISRERAKNYSDGKLEQILKSMNVKYEVRDAHYSRIPYEDSKMFIVDGDIKKSTLIKIVEEKLQ